MKTISPFENFNARYSTQEEVAVTFVSNDDFFSIAKNNHTFVIGPRGCGKTTMFKMLSSTAMSNWEPSTLEEQELKDNLPFIAIYIPSDELWCDQLETFKQNRELKGLDAFVDNAFASLNVLINFCTSIKKHIDTLAPENKIEKEIQYSDLLIKYWDLGQVFSSLKSIENELGKKRSDLIKKIKKYYPIYSEKDIKPDIEFEDFYYLDFLTEIKNAITSFERVYCDDKEQKWALCFDELELVSKNFSNQLLKQLRISPPNIVFKLSSGPLTNFDDNYAQVFHDYQVVKMWPNNITAEEEYADFCEKIAIKRIKQHRAIKRIKQHVDIDFTALLGDLNYSDYALKDFQLRSKIDVSAKESEANSETWWIFKLAASKDLSLCKAMDDRRMNPENPIPRTQLNYDSFIRKAKEIVANRLVFSKQGKTTQNDLVRRSRKVFPIYYGKKTIFKICEGNPRFIMNIIDELVIKSGRYTNIVDERFSPKEQVDVIQIISERFNAMLKSYPASIIYNNKEVDLIWLIKEIGLYFEKELNQKEFKLNPANSFKFNKKRTNTNLFELIEIGVGLGAFIKIDKSEDDIEHDDLNTRYRLTYLLHPLFNLPLRLYSSVSLFNIIRRDDEPKLNFKFKK